MGITCRHRNSAGKRQQCNERAAAKFEGHGSCCMCFAFEMQCLAFERSVDDATAVECWNLFGFLDDVCHVRVRVPVPQAVSPRVASQKMVDFPQFKKFLRARSQRLSQALSPNGEHHLADVVVEVYPDDQVGKSSAEAKSGGTVAIPQVVALGSPPQRKLVSRISSSAVAEATTEIDL